ncbi:hypothetical protein PAEPH01_0065 [Pancytospora epiphaga]|nr:hypothetical protein PAEPH01_0065 [Pancytospora epiphaga]
MSLYEPDYLGYFHAVVTACEQYPHTVKLQRTGRPLTLYNINSVFYIDTQNMFYFLEELFDTSVPPTIKEYIKKVLFIETISLDDKSGPREKELICINFIDNNTLLKFHNWLLDYYSIENEDESLFQKIQTSTIGQGLFSSGQNKVSDKRPDDIFSFGCWDAGDRSSEGRAQSEENGYGNPRSYVRPRGKHMPCRKEPSYERPFICEYHECKRAFKRLEHLKRHQKMHTGERPYKCLFPGCYKAFSRSDNLNSHYKTHNVPRRKPYHPFEYGKSFESI